MDRENAVEIARAAIKSASGKTLSEATSILADILEGLELAAKQEDTFSVAESVPDLPPPPVVKSPSNLDPIEELAPIDRSSPTPSRSVVRIIHTVEQIQNQIMEGTPAVISFIPEGATEELSIFRYIMVDNGNPPSVQIAYRPKDLPPEAPYPKLFLWSTEESYDMQAIMAKINSDARSMYRIRQNQIVTRVAQMGPVETRYAKREQV